MLNKINKKNILLIGVPILILIVIIILLVILLNKNDNLGFVKNTDGVKIKEEYEKLNGKKSNEDKIYPEVKISEENIMKYTTSEEIINIINNKKDAVVYFGYPSCIYCRTVIEVLLYSSNDTGLDNILYLDTEKEKVNNELLNLLGDTLTTDNNVYTPLVIFIVNGEIVSYRKDTIYSHKDPYIELDNSGIEGLSEIYKLGINDVVKSKNLK